MNKRKNNKKIYQLLISLIALIAVIVLAYLEVDMSQTDMASTNSISRQNTILELSELPNFSASPYIEINNNIPYFTKDDYTSKPFEIYSELDELGRCGVAYANICKETMPPEGDKRGKISSVEPTGWVQNKYDGEYLFNRCHLIGYQLSGEDANNKNLITGTRYFNVEGMLPFENNVAEYIDSYPNNHVLYRVTPIYEGNNLLANGVLMEAWSVEDKGQGVCFNVYCYNVQPGVFINYTTGENHSE